MVLVLLVKQCFKGGCIGEGMEQRKDRLQAGLERVGIHSPAKLLI